MQVVGDRFVASATDLSGFLACSHLTTLDLRAAKGGPKPPKYPDPGREVLQKRGEEHEAEILARFREQGLDIACLEVDREQGRDGRWDRYAAETLEQMRAGKDVIHQACLFDGQWLGLPDFLIKVDRPSDLGDWSYEVVDAKLARSAKVGAVLQICFYSDLLETVQGIAPERMHLALGSASQGADGEDGFEEFRVADFAAYYRSVKRRFLDSVGAAPDTYPEPCEHCVICKWSPVCRRQWRDDDYLSLVAGISRKQRSALEATDVSTLAGLARLPLPPATRLESVSDPAFTKIREQARIQLEGREEDRHKYEILPHAEPKSGLLALPEPSAGDLFFDIEGDPHAFGDGLEYLLGYVDVDAAFTGLWALDPDTERQQFEAFIDMVVERLERWPDLHIYHYAAYEKTALKRLAAKYATREEEVDQLLRGEVLVDLYRVVRQGIRASVESYSIKKLEPLYGFDRGVELREASSALANFEAWLQLGGGTGADELLEQIAGYNEDDCVSTLKLRDWLEERRAELQESLRDRGELKGDLPRPEPPTHEPNEKAEEVGERVRALVDELTDDVPADPGQRSAEQQGRWILAQLLSFHRREKRSMWWEYFRMRDLDTDELIADAKPIGGLEFDKITRQIARSEVYRYRFPPQDTALHRGDNPHDTEHKGSAGEIVAIDPEAGWVELKRGPTLAQREHPKALIPLDKIPDHPLDDSLLRLADDVVAGAVDSADPAAWDLLLRKPPKAGQTPGASLRGTGETNLDAARRLALALDSTVLPIQGPPGSGKTYVGARMITALLAAGKRVGVTATGHKVITNLLDEVCRAATEEGVGVRGIQKGSAKSGCADDRFEITGKNEAVPEALAEGEANIAAGTPWLWAREEMGGTVDVLFVDEAGQISLANVLATARAADSVVLLGDPQQLDQPLQGVHPPGTGVSVLDHLVGETTLRPDRGLFLEQTWRLHPDICGFTSELYYEGRLSSRLELAQQQVCGPGPFDGAGLRFVPVEHQGNGSESIEEVEGVRALVETLLERGSTWIDAEGKEQPLDLEQMLIVAPYNAQVKLLREALPEDARVGTVDKFQGQQAAVVIVSMTASSISDAPRGMDFLFSPNRLNVATSRARCVAVLVGSPELLTPDCRSVRQMRLANGVCRFGEMAMQPLENGRGANRC